MAIRNRREKWLLREASVPLALLALSCIYLMFFPVNTALKTHKGYILDRFGVVDAPSLENFFAASTWSHLGEYLMNSVTVTAGAVALPGLRWPLHPSSRSTSSSSARSLPASSWTQ